MDNLFNPIWANEIAKVGKKYEFTGKVKEGLLEIVAVRDFGNVKKGQTGGFIEDQSCLSHEGNCWIDVGACVYEHSRVEGNSYIGKNTFLKDWSCVSGNSFIGDRCSLSGVKVLDSELGNDIEIYAETCWIRNSKLKSNLFFKGGLLILNNIK